MVVQIRGEEGIFRSTKKLGFATIIIFETFRDGGKDSPGRYQVRHYKNVLGPNFDILLSFFFAAVI